MGQRAGPGRCPGHTDAALPAGHKGYAQINAPRSDAVAARGNDDRVMETLVDEVARASKSDPVALRRQWLGSKHPRHRAALDLAVAKSGYGTRTLPAGRA
jgi:CO/xanthine dehydrogenase Mo-binding subunit